MHFLYCMTSINNSCQWFSQLQQNVLTRRAAVSYLEAEVRDDGWEAIRPEQRHHQLLQALVHLKVLPEEWRHKENPKSKHEGKWVWMIFHWILHPLVFMQILEKGQYDCFLHFFIISKWHDFLALLHRHSTHSSPPWAARRARAAAGLADVHPQSRHPPEYPAGSSSGRLLPGTLYTAVYTHIRHSVWAKKAKVQSNST